jgi:CRISPR-associated protein Cmr6
MTDSPFAPLYKEASQAVRTNAAAHGGLLFDKFADAWRWNQDKKPKIPEFDKGGPNKKRPDAAESEKEGSWLRRFAALQCGSEKLLREACDRQRQLANRVGGCVLQVTNREGRFATGLGREHPLENGFVWHHTLGVPYLPGSSLKGMLRAWMREQEGSFVTENGQGAWKESPRISDWFGNQQACGRFVLLDMLPQKPPRLAVDVMTPHYGPYYQEGELPGDWHSPIPIAFLTVDRGSEWQLAILPSEGQRRLDQDELAGVQHSIEDALKWAGAGAKTAVGYGRFVRVPEEEPGRASQAGNSGSAAPLSRPRPRYKAGDPVTVTRIEDPKGKGRIWFQAEDGFSGTLTGTPPQEVASLALGQQTHLEVASIGGNNDSYNFRTPRPPGQQRSSGNVPPRRGPLGRGR